MRWSCVWLVAGAMLAGAPVAAQPDAREDEARWHFQAGTALIEQGRTKEAIEELKQAYLLFPQPELLFNLGQAYRLDGQWEMALRSYQGYLREAPSAANRAQVEGWIRELKAKVPEAGHMDSPRQPAIQRVPAPPPPPPSPAPGSPPGEATAGRTLRIAGIAVGGAGVVALGLGGFFASRAASTWDDLNQEASEGGVSWTADHMTRYERAEDDETRAWVLGAAGLALLAGGGILYVVGAHAPTDVTVGVTPTADTVAVSLRGGF